MDVSNAVELLFDTFIYDKHPEITSFSLHKENKKPKSLQYKLSIFVDLNMVDLDIGESIIIEDYHLLGPEYDNETSEYIYDMIRSNIINTTNECLRLINLERKIPIDIILQY